MGSPPAGCPGQGDREGGSQLCRIGQKACRFCGADRPTGRLPPLLSSAPRITWSRPGRAGFSASSGKDTQVRTGAQRVPFPPSWVRGPVLTPSRASPAPRPDALSLAPLPRRAAPGERARLPVMPVDGDGDELAHRQLKLFGELVDGFRLVGMDVERFEPGVGDDEAPA